MLQKLLQETGAKNLIFLKKEGRSFQRKRCWSQTAREANVNGWQRWSSSSLAHDWPLWYPRWNIWYCSSTKQMKTKKDKLEKKIMKDLLSWIDMVLIAFVITNIYLQFWVWCVCLYNSLHIIFVVTILFCHRLKQTKCWSWSIQSDPDPNFFFFVLFFFFCISC